MPDPKDEHKTPDPVFLGYYPDGEPVYSDKLREKVEEAWRLKEEKEDADI